ncbi:MAG TPA: MFS transporter [Streptosporangiaceae bacterium]|nr:MFS transporter [Streptosporangiaceae bacterium]
MLATVLGSGMVLLDTTAVNVALPTIGRDLGSALSGLQWIMSGYTLALAALILLGGSLGDRLGRRRVFIAGVIWFAVASAMCGLAPTVQVLVAARVLQGAGGAMLVPGALAIIQASFAPWDRSRAIGAWAGLGNLATAAGPLVGGWLVAAVGWRLVFLVNLPVAVTTVIVALRWVPESRDDYARGSFDVLGAFLAALALAGIALALISGPGSRGWERVGVLAAAITGAGAAAVFLAVERARGRSVSERVPAPMLPLAIFASRQFSAINVITFCVYCATAGELFMLVLELQAGAGFTALAAGSALLPVTAAMIVLSPCSAALAQRIGPRWPLTAGAVTCAAGLLLALRIGVGSSYLRDVLPAVAVFGVGIALIVSPLTSTVLASADVRNAGVASGVNNAVTRVAGLIAVAGLPAAAGLRAAAYDSPVRLTGGFHVTMIVCAALLALAALLAAMLVDDRVLHHPGPRGHAETRGYSDDQCATSITIRQPE